MSAARPGSDILRGTRWLAAVIIPFLVVAAVVLFGAPDRTRALFAWEIKPPMTAMMLGAAYAGGVWFFGRTLVARHWREVKVGFPAVGAFASILGVATILHWDRFIHEAPAFWLWAILYFSTPFLVFGTWYRQRRIEVDPGDPEPVLPRWLRGLLGIVGVAMVAVSIALFIAPAAVGGAWPWTLTPLTTRVMSAMFALPGIVGIGIAFDPRWSVARIVFEAQALSIALILIGVWRDQADIAIASPAGLAFLAGMGSLLAILVVTYAWMEPRARTASKAEAIAT